MEIKIIKYKSQKVDFLSFFKGKSYCNFHYNELKAHSEDVSPMCRLRSQKRATELGEDLKINIICV